MLTNCVKHLRQVDGYRCLVSKRDGWVVLWSRRGNGFTARFPAIARACETPLATAFDSLIVGYYEDAKLKFVGQGQERLRSTHVLRDPPALPGAED
jgi:ATP-dependent DNA ligase